MSGKAHSGGPFNESLDRGTSPEAPTSTEEAPDRCCAREQLRQVLAAALQTLPTRYQRVVTLFYSHCSTMKQIGAELGVNESRVSQIHKAALEKLNQALKNQGN